MKQDSRHQDSRHFVIAPVGSLGDVYPACGIAKALVGLGHSVEVVAEELFRPQITSKGLAFRGFGTPERLQQVLHDARLWNGNRSFMTEAAFSPCILPHFRAVEEAYRRHGGRVVVIATCQAAGALFAAERFGLRSFGLLSSPAALSLYLEEVPVADIAFRAAFYAVDLPALPAAVTEDGRKFFGEYLLAYDHLLEMFPRWFDTRVKNRPAHCLAGTFPGEAAEATVLEVQQFARSGPSPWIFFPGTGGALTTARPDFFAMVKEVCGRTGRRGILVDRTLETDFHLVTPTLAAIRHTNFNELLPHARGLFHHGGVGATSQALACGRPQIIAPVAFDQPGNASWVAHSGCGLRCRTTELDVARIEALLDEAEALPEAPRRAAAARLAEEGGADGLARTILTVLKGAREAA